MIVCDGCGAYADDRHIRERIQRLELASRFRPIHIQVLLLDAAPPARREDYFYPAAKDRTIRSAESLNYFDEITGCSGKLSGSEIQEDSALESLQRRGLFLAHAFECQIQETLELASAVKLRTPTLLKRLQASYRPKFVALLSESLEVLIPVLQNAGWGDRLILDQGRPFSSPLLGDLAGSGFGRLRDRLTRAPAGDFQAAGEGL